MTWIFNRGDIGASFIKAILYLTGHNTSNLSELVMRCFYFFLHGHFIVRKPTHCPTTAAHITCKKKQLHNSTVGRKDIYFQFMMEKEDILFLLLNQKQYFTYNKETTKISYRWCGNISLCCPAEVHSLPNSKAMESCLCLYAVSFMHKNWAMSFHKFFDYLSEMYLTIFVRFDRTVVQTAIFSKLPDQLPLGRAICSCFSA